MGLPMEHVLRQCLISMRLADRLGLDGSDRGVVYYTALLAWVGCHVDAYEQAKWFGDDLALKADARSVDFASPAAARRFMVDHFGSGLSLIDRAKLGAELMRTGLPRRLAAMERHCYAACDLAVQLGLGEDVEIHGHCTQADLHAFYRCADLFWSFSEHEGFCVPLVEAMWFDVPVLALASSAVPETLAAAGIAFSWGEDDVAVASLAERLLVDEALRARVLARQRVRRQDFTPARVAEAVTRFVARITSASHEAVHEPA